MYVDDILLIGSDIVGINETKEYLTRYFVTMDMENPGIFWELGLPTSRTGWHCPRGKFMYEPRLVHWQGPYLYYHIHFLRFCLQEAFDLGYAGDNGHLEVNLRVLHVRGRQSSYLAK